MNREEKIMKRVQEHYNYLKEKGFEIVFLALQGSQNYGLDVLEKTKYEILKMRFREELKIK